MEEKTVLTRKDVDVVIPPLNSETKASMERCAEFLARMIHKYGKEIQNEKREKEEDAGDPDETPLAAG